MEDAVFNKFMHLLVCTWSAAGVDITNEVAQLKGG